MSERACCDDIVKAGTRLDAHDFEIAAIKASVEGFEERITVRLDRIDERLTAWVNPVIAVVITIMATLLGFAGGIIAMLWHAATS